MRSITPKGGQFGPNFLQRPLNEVLGSEVKVRIIRYLVKKDKAFAKSEIARGIGVSATGVGKAITDLAFTGFVESIGGGKRKLWQVRKAEPLIKTLKKVFEHEEKN